MNFCIYCRVELPDKVPPEHIVPQGFGVFTPDHTLNCVCSSCNGYFGSKLEWPMRNESVEGARRFQFNLGAGKIGTIGTSGIIMTVGEGDDWKGARAILQLDQNGNTETMVLPQVGARRNDSGDFDWVLEKDLSKNWADKYPKGSQFRIVGGRGSADIQRLLGKLKTVCPTYVHGGEMKAPFSADGMVMLHSEHQMNRTVARCLCKIAFNYMAYICGNTFVLSKEFDGMREFIRNDVGDDINRVFIKRKGIIAQEILSGERGADGHVLTVEGRPKDRSIEVQVALFNSIPYRIPMGDYLGHPFAKGHYFCVHSWEASEMLTTYAGPDFDPETFMQTLGE
jgi:hypothetical protein